MGLAVYLPIKRSTQPKEQQMGISIHRSSHKPFADKHLSVQRKQKGSIYTQNPPRQNPAISSNKPGSSPSETMGIGKVAVKTTQQKQSSRHTTREIEKRRTRNNSFSHY
jgi:hypothetical protein